MKWNVMYAMAFSAAMTAMLLDSAPVCATEADAGIDPAFRKTYVYRTYLQGDKINIESQSGVVTLTGTVADESHKALAQDTVASLPDVSRVDNQLVTVADVAAENADVWMARKIKLALMFHRNVNASKTTVEVKDGIATLTGEASSLAQKELTTEYAKDIEGVIEVKNEMTVAEAQEPEERTASEKVDDASITAQVKMALLTHRSTSAITTKVETRNGEVTLTGIAKNAAETSLITKIVTDIQGVTVVKNLMTIEEVKAK